VWIFAKKGFLSIVAHRDRPGFLLVRSRYKGDIESLFPGFDSEASPYEIEETAAADYRYRCTLPYEIVASIIHDQVAAIDYPNFKNEISEPGRHTDYTRVWGVMAGAQDRRLPVDRGPGLFDDIFDDEVAPV